MTDDLTNPNSHNRLVAGSKPAEPTIEANSTSFGGDSLQKVADSPSDLLQLRELLQILLGNKGEGTGAEVTFPQTFWLRG